MGISKTALIAVVISTVGGLVVARWLLHLVLRSALRLKAGAGADRNLRDRVLLRYENGDFHTWMFAWWKTRLDPMFDELPELLKPLSNVHTLLDLGCGFGFASSLLLECFPDAKIYAVEPSKNRVRQAALILGNRGHVSQAAAPDFESPDFPIRFDAAFFLDVLHFLSDADLDLTLRRIRARLREGDRLFIRGPVPPIGFGSLRWNSHKLHRILTGNYACFRSPDQIRERITKAGFDVVWSRMSGTNPELVWFVCSALKPSDQADHANDFKNKEDVSDDEPAAMKAGEFVPLL